MTDLRCAWCNEPWSEHGGFGVGCDEFIPVDHRARAHAIVDAMLDDAALRGVVTGNAAALRAAFRNHIMYMQWEAER